MGFYLAILLQAAQAHAHGDGEEAFCRWIIISLASAIVSMAIFIVKQFTDRIRDLKDAKELSNSLLEVVRRDRGTR